MWPGNLNALNSICDLQALQHNEQQHTAQLCWGNVEVCASSLASATQWGRLAGQLLAIHAVHAPYTPVSAQAATAGLMFQ